MRRKVESEQLFSVGAGNSAQSIPACDAGRTAVDGIEGGDHVGGMRRTGCNDDERARRWPLARDEVWRVPP
jgi:hypothetical protein